MIEQIYTELFQFMREFGRAPHFVLIGAKQYLALCDEMKSDRRVLPGTAIEPTMLAWNGGYLSIVCVTAVDRLEYGWAPVNTRGGATPPLMQEIIRGNTGSLRRGAS